jgi:uracil phosphoribosyltransferase
VVKLRLTKSAKLCNSGRRSATPLGTSPEFVLKNSPFGYNTESRSAVTPGLLNYFDKADNAFISAYRKHRRDGSFDISLEYISCPPLDDRILIIADPMLATGSSLVKTIQFLRKRVSPGKCTLLLRLHARWE